MYARYTSPELQKLDFTVHLGEAHIHFPTLIREHHSTTMLGLHSSIL